MKPPLLIKGLTPTGSGVALAILRQLDGGSIEDCVDLLKAVQALILANTQVNSHVIEETALKAKGAKDEAFWQRFVAQFGSATPDQPEQAPPKEAADPLRAAVQNLINRGLLLLP